MESILWHWYILSVNSICKSRLSTMSTLTERLLIGRNPDGNVYIFTPLHLCWFSIVPLGPFDGRVAAVVGDFVCTMPNQTCIFLPLMQKSEVKLRADIRYGPDDATLWPQPWVKMFCHLCAIPRKPEDPNDPLSIMWWDLTLDDFKSFGGSLIDGLCHRFWCDVITRAEFKHAF